MRVLGIDTSLRSSGIGVVESDGTRLRAVMYATLRVAAGERLSTCLKRIGDGIADAIRETGAEEAAVEGGFYGKNVRTAVVLGQARGAAIAACVGMEVPVFEYSPRRVKQAVVGVGGADKLQVRRMIMQLLGLDSEPQEDAGDALAIAICHLHGRSAYEALRPEQV